MAAVPVAPPAVAVVAVPRVAAHIAAAVPQAEWHSVAAGPAEVAAAQGEALLLLVEVLPGKF